MRYKKIILLIICIVVLFFKTPCFALNSDELYAQSAILIDTKTSKILFEKDIDKKMYPASTTKIVTAILTIENCKLDEEVIVNLDAISSIPPGYATAGLVVDEKVTIKQLLEVLLLHSANDAANVLAIHVGGSIDSFVSMMNSKAKELGCDDTNFTNTYGLHDENHYTTARDLAIITKYCMQNNIFRQFISQENCQIPPTNKHEERTYKNTNDLINPSSIYYYKNSIGGKTGYTKEAGNCLISASKNNGFETIAVVLNTGTIHGARYSDSIALFNYAYDTFKIKKFANKNDIITQTTVFNGTKETKKLDLILSEDINALSFKKEDIKNITPEIKLKRISAPIAEGSVLGTATYNILNTEYKVNLLASHDVEKSDSLILFLAIFIIIIIITILIIILIKINKK